MSNSLNSKKISETPLSAQIAIASDIVNYINDFFSIKSQTNRLSVVVETKYDINDTSLKQHVNVIHMNELKIGDNQSISAITKIEDLGWSVLVGGQAVPYNN